MMFEDEDLDITFAFNSVAESTPKVRMVGLFSGINEKTSADVISSMILLANTTDLVPEVREKKKGRKPKQVNFVEVVKPFDFYISTHGGSAPEMFSIYDTMRMLKQSCEIHTFGLGKVMSAGTLLLAAGTKGHRKIGKSCRVMFHGIKFGFQGSLADCKNNLLEIQEIQKLYVEAMIQETKMQEQEVLDLIKSNDERFLSAEQVVELGIADAIV